MEIGILLLAMVSPFLYAACNHLDNILLSKYFQEGGVGTLMLFSAFLSILALPLLWLLDPSVFAVTMEHKFVLFGVGIINTILLWAYLQAIFGDDPTDVIIYYQIVPVIGLVLGYVVIGETITLIEIFGMTLVIVGALALTFSKNAAGDYQFRGRTLGYMLVASFCWALESTIFKVVALEENPVRSFFWEHVALVVIGVGIFALVPHYRKSFVAALRLNSVPIIGLNLVNEGSYMLANFIAALVVVMAPVSLTLLVSNSFQPVFVLLIGLGLMKFLPGLEVDHVDTSNMRQKVLAIVLTGVGVLMIGDW